MSDQVWDPRNPLAVDYYAEKRRRREKKLTSTSKDVTDMRQGMYSNLDYVQEDAQEYQAIYNVDAFGKDENYLPDLPMDQREQIGKQLEESFKTGTFDWNDFLKFAESQFPGRGALTYWGQPVGGQDFMNSPTYMAISISLAVGSLFTGFLADAALTGIQLMIEGKVESAAQEIIRSMIPVQEDEKAQMFASYFMWKAAGWWDGGRKTDTFLTYKNETIAKAKNNFDQLVKDMQASREAWKKGLENFQSSLTYLETRLRVIEQMEKWATTHRKAYESGNILDPYEGKNLDLLDMNSRYFDEVIQFDLGAEKEQLLADIAVIRGQQGLVDNAQQQQDAAANARWTNEHKAANNWVQRVFHQKGTAGEYDEWAWLMGDVLVLEKMSPEKRTRVQYNGKTKEQEVQEKLDAYFKKYGISVRFTPYQFFNANFSDTMAGLVSVAYNDRTTYFDTYDPPQWYRELNPDWQLYDRNKGLYDESLKLRNEWEANPDMQFDFYGQRIAPPEVNISPDKPNTTNVGTSQVGSSGGKTYNRTENGLSQTVNDYNQRQGEYREGGVLTRDGDRWVYQG